jgi:hypothetical protein
MAGLDLTPIRWPGLLMIGAAGRNAGKTLLACAVIRAHSARQPVVGVKVTAIDPNHTRCPRGGEGCGVCTSLKGDFEITEETDDISGKDTARLLAAGAERVFWLRVRRNKLLEGVRALQQRIGPDAVCVCESNSLRQAVVPDLFLMARESGSTAFKESALAVKHHVDRIVTFDGQAHDMSPADLCLIDGQWTLC